MLGVATADTEGPGPGCDLLARLDVRDVLAQLVDDADDVLAQRERDGRALRGGRPERRYMRSNAETPAAWTLTLAASAGGFRDSFMHDPEHVRTSMSRYRDATVFRPTAR